MGGHMRALLIVSSWISSRLSFSWSMPSRQQQQQCAPQAQQQQVKQPCQLPPTKWQEACVPKTKDPCAPQAKKQCPPKSTAQQKCPSTQQDPKFKQKWGWTGSHRLPTTQAARRSLVFLFLLSPLAPRFPPPSTYVQWSGSVRLLIKRITYALLFFKASFISDSDVSQVGMRENSISSASSLIIIRASSILYHTTTE